MLGFTLGDGGTVWVCGHLGLYNFGDVQGANLVAHKLIKPCIDVAIKELVDAFTGGGRAKESHDGHFHATGVDALEAVTSP